MYIGIISANLAAFFFCPMKAVTTLEKKCFANVPDSLSDLHLRVTSLESCRVASCPPFTQLNARARKRKHDQRNWNSRHRSRRRRRFSTAAIVKLSFFDQLLNHVGIL